MEDSTILVLEDSRNYGKLKTPGTQDTTPAGLDYVHDPRVWSAASFGRRLISGLPQTNGYYSEVLDCGKYVVCKASYVNPATGKGVSKQFVVVFDNPKTGDGNVFCTSTKWRTISSVDQAVNYIGSYIKALAGTTNNA